MVHLIWLSIELIKPRFKKIAEDEWRSCMGNIFKA